MKIAYFDCFSGISGDMAVGALLDAGVPLRIVEEALEKIGLGSGRLQVSTRSITRSQIHATKFDVMTPEGIVADEVSLAESHSHSLQHEHTHGSHHEHTHKAAHTHSDDENNHRHHHHEQSSYQEIVEMIDASELDVMIKERSKSIFRAIGIAEARIHNTTLEEVHFHEVGALDSIADVIAIAACLHHLGIDEVYASPVPLGSGGTIMTQHGAMPLPAPATLEILKGYPVALTALPFELTTPTGAGLIKGLSKGTLASEQLQVERVGFGAGTRELPDRPNLLRVIVGELLAEEERDAVTLIETNIDDMNPQVYPYLLERLLEGGAYDAYLTPVIMKKGRPGMVLSVVAPAGAVDGLTKVIYRETTTIGVRYREMNRRKLPREEILAQTEWGVVRMKKIETLDGLRVVPEYEEARRIARERALPLHEILVKLESIARHIATDGH